MSPTTFGWGFKFILKIMKELMTIYSREGKKAISARELYAFLSIDDGSHFSRWSKTNIEDMFVQNIDYQILRHAGESFGRPGIDFALPLDIAKEVAMMSRCEKGKQARQYFIEVEKQFKAIASPVRELPQTYVAALRELANEVELRELAEKKVFELEPKAEVFDRIANAGNLLAMNSAAKSLGTTRPKLFKLLRDRSILMGNNLPYQRYIESGMFNVKIKPIEMGHSGSIDYPQTFVTAKGLAWLGKGIVKLEKEKGENINDKAKT